MSVSVLLDQSSVCDVRERAAVGYKVSQSAWVVDDVEQFQRTQLQLTTSSYHQNHPHHIIIIAIVIVVTIIIINHHHHHHHHHHLLEQFKKHSILKQNHDLSLELDKKVQTCHSLTHNNIKVNVENKS